MLHIDYVKRPLLWSKPIWNTQENREKMMELASEKFDAPAFYMTAYKATGIFSDSGGSITSNVPVYGGYVIKEDVLERLSNDLRMMVPSYKIKVYPAGSQIERNLIELAPSSSEI
ncbi:hypothetical protein EDC94DRAFT_649538 [Helicostylum pulchrum]|nr:hypothetical protein EDC94DRAFT_649538 [Helicostylum pulchrum]